MAVDEFPLVIFPTTATFPTTPVATVHVKLLNDVLSGAPPFNDARAVNVAVGLARFALIANGASRVVAVLLTLATTDASSICVADDCTHPELPLPVVTHAPTLKLPAVNLVPSGTTVTLALPSKSATTETTLVEQVPNAVVLVPIFAPAVLLTK